MRDQWVFLSFITDFMVKYAGFSLFEQSSIYRKMHDYSGTIITLDIKKWLSISSASKIRHSDLPFEMSSSCNQIHNVQASNQQFFIIYSQRALLRASWEWLEVHLCISWSRPIPLSSWQEGSKTGFCYPQVSHQVRATTTGTLWALLPLGKIYNSELEVQTITPIKFHSTGEKF